MQSHQKAFDCLFQGAKINKSRKEFMLIFVLSAMQQRSVQLSRIAETLNDDALPESNMRRIQAFFKDYELDMKMFVRAWFSILSGKKVVLCIDRTNWKWGDTNINILMLTACVNNISIPLFFELLPKRGNSSQNERIDLIEKFIQIFGYKQIKYIVGDREFIGEKWVSFLKENHVDCCMRMKKNMLVTLSNGSVKSIQELVNVEHKEEHFENVEINGTLGNLAIKKLPKEEDGLLAVFGSLPVDTLLSAYRNRWSIEAFFQNLKKRGFNLEDTHVRETKKLITLLLLICTAYVFCIAIGLWRNKQKPIPKKKHGYKAFSFFRYGLNLWRQKNNLASIEKIMQFIDIVFQNLVSNKPVFDFF